MGAETKLLIAAILAGFGIALPWSEFIGGMFLAIAAAFLVMAFTDPVNRKTYFLTLAAAVICAIGAAIARDAMFPSWHPQLMMFCAGALSTFIVEAAQSFGSGLIEQARSWPARFADRWFGKGGGDA